MENDESGDVRGYGDLYYLLIHYHWRHLRRRTSGGGVGLGLLSANRDESCEDDGSGASSISIERSRGATFCRSDLRRHVSCRS